MTIIFAPVDKMAFSGSADVKTADIYLDEIDWDDNFFKISSTLHPQKITQSISAIGLINQPWVVAKNNKISIVSGFNRLWACRRLNLTSISVKQLDPKTSLKECAVIAIADNAFQRPLNIIEQSRGYALLDSVCEDKQTFLKLLSVAGLSNNFSWIAKVMPLCNLPQSVQDGIGNEAIPLAIAQMLSEMEKNTAIFLSRLFQDLSLGLNKQREIIQISSEIAKRDDLTILEIFYEKEMLAIIENPRLDKNRKASMIRQRLRHQRYPHLSQKNENFENAIRQLKLGNQVRLSPPAYFEGKNFNLSFDFSTQQQLTRFKDTIADLEKNASLKSLLEK